jgi:hypothetical protein
MSNTATFGFFIFPARLTELEKTCNLAFKHFFGYEKEVPLKEAKQQQEQEKEDEAKCGMYKGRFKRGNHQGTWKERKKMGNSFDIFKV